MQTRSRRGAGTRRAYLARGSSGGRPRGRPHRRCGRRGRSARAPPRPLPPARHHPRPRAAPPPVATVPLWRSPCLEVPHGKVGVVTGYDGRQLAKDGALNTGTRAALVLEPAHPTHRPHARQAPCPWASLSATVGTDIDSRSPARPWHSPSTVPAGVLATQPTTRSAVARSTVALRKKTPGGRWPRSGTYTRARATKTRSPPPTLHRPKDLKAEARQPTRVGGRHPTAAEKQQRRRRRQHSVRRAAPMTKNGRDPGRGLVTKQQAQTVSHSFTAATVCVHPHARGLDRPTRWLNLPAGHRTTLSALLRAARVVRTATL
jgi:hypothetical protein